MTIAYTDHSGHMGCVVPRARIAASLRKAMTLASSARACAANRSLHASAAALAANRSLHASSRCSPTSSSWCRFSFMCTASFSRARFCSSSLPCLRLSTLPSWLRLPSSPLRPSALARLRCFLILRRISFAAAAVLVVVVAAPLLRASDLAAVPAAHALCQAFLVDTEGCLALFLLLVICSSVALLRSGCCCSCNCCSCSFSSCCCPAIRDCCCEMVRCRTRS